MKFLSCSLLLSSLLLLNACGSSSGGSKDATPANPTSSNAASFTAMNAALTASCAGSSCHGSGSRYGVFVGNQSNVDANLDDIYEEVSSGRMPLGKSLSAEDKATILAYTRR